MNRRAHHRRGPTRFDWFLAAACFAGFETELIVDAATGRLHDNVPLAVPILVIAGMTLSIAWRRRWPICAAAASMASTVMLAVSSNADLRTLNTPQLALFVVPYGVAAHSSRRRGLWGLVVCIAAISAVNLHGNGEAFSWVFTVGACSGSWVTGRLVQAHRDLATELNRAIGRIAAEREGRELLAIAEQRSRIARELQTLVAHSISTMIVQTLAAQRLLAEQSTQADVAMATIEDTGREALGEMRRILGVLRHAQVPVADLAPQPGIGQIPALVETVRQSPRDLTLQVEGTPGPLPASVDLGVYRILEDALASVDDRTAALDIVLRLGSADVELEVISPLRGCLNWPTVTMRERVALCRGDIDVDAVAEGGERLRVRLPRVFEAALT